MMFEFMLSCFWMNSRGGFCL